MHVAEIKDLYVVVLISLLPSHRDVGLLIIQHSIYTTISA